jgi:hypothetical protein
MSTLDTRISLCLVETDGPDEPRVGTVFDLGRGRSVLGRGPSAHVRLPHGTVSNEHIVLDVASGKVRFENRARNGLTVVNDAQLQPGDSRDVTAYPIWLQIGSYLFRIDESAITQQPRAVLRPPAVDAPSAVLTLRLGREGKPLSAHFFGVEMALSGSMLTVLHALMLHPNENVERAVIMPGVAEERRAAALDQLVFHLRQRIADVLTAVRDLELRASKCLMRADPALVPIFEQAAPSPRDISRLMVRTAYGRGYRLAMHPDCVRIDEADTV